MADVCQVTGTIVDLTNENWSDGALMIQRVNDATVPGNNDISIGQPIPIVTNASGVLGHIANGSFVAGFNLVRGHNYIAVATRTDVQTQLPAFRLSVPSTLSSANIATLLVTDPVPPLDQATQAVIDALMAASAAAASATAAGNTLSDFETRYLGAKATDPTTDNEGNALIVGALYFNTVSDQTRAYDGTNWGALGRRHNVVNVLDYGADPTGTTDSTTAFQNAMNAADALFAANKAFPLGVQYPDVILPSGHYLISDTLFPTATSANGGRGYPCLVGPSTPGSCSIEWRDTSGTSKPLIDLRDKGENFQMLNIRTYVDDATYTLPSVWVKSTTFIDHDASFEGCYFGLAQSAWIEYGGVTNGHLNDFRGEATNGTGIRITNTAGSESFNRVLRLQNWTMHARNSDSLSMDSIVHITLGTNDSYTVQFDGQRIELDHQGIDSTQFDFVYVDGASSQSPAVNFACDFGGMQTNLGNYAGTLGAVRSATTGNINVGVEFRSFRPEELDAFVAGNIQSLSQWPATTSFANRLLDFQFHTSANAVTFRGSLKTEEITLGNATFGQTNSGDGYVDGDFFSRNLLLARESAALTALSITSGAIDISSADSTMIHVASSGAVSLHTINGGKPGQLIYLRGTADGEVSLSFNASGNIRMARYGQRLYTEEYMPLLFDPNANVWRPAFALNLRPESTELKTATAAQLADATLSINTAGKRGGTQVWDTTNNRLVFAGGTSATSLWYVVDGSDSITPS